MKRRFPLLSALILAVATASTGSAAPPTTLLSGFVGDPVGGRGIGSAVVRMGPERVRVDTDGGFTVESSARGRRPYPTRFRAPGFLPYRSWTPVGEELRRDVLLFPAGEFDVPGYTGSRVGNPVSREEFLNHFDAVWRDTHGGFYVEGLTRWEQQPRIFIVDRVVGTVSYGLESYWRMGERLTLRDRRRVRTLLRQYTPLLTGGRYSAGRVRWKKFRAGEEIRQEYANLLEPGEIVIAFVEPQPGVTGSGGVQVEGNDVVSGVNFISRHYLEDDLAEEWGGHVIVHELGHALGMRHGPHSPTAPSVPLCSVMGNRRCRHEGHVSPIDLVTARLAYSRMSGNDHRDRDPRPRREDAAASPRQARWIHFDQAGEGPERRPPTAR